MRQLLSRRKVLLKLKFFPICCSKTGTRRSSISGTAQLERLRIGSGVAARSGKRKPPTEGAISGWETGRLRCFLSRSFTRIWDGDRYARQPLADFPGGQSGVQARWSRLSSKTVDDALIEG